MVARRPSKLMSSIRANVFHFAGQEYELVFLLSQRNGRLQSGIKQEKQPVATPYRE